MGNRMLRANLILLLVWIITSCSVKTITDPDGHSYPIKRINGLVWMTTNLNFSVDSSFCYDNNPLECDTMGRLYTWEGAIDAANQIKGWHLPTQEEWAMLLEHCGNDSLGYHRIISEETGFYPQWAGARLATGHYVAKKHHLVNYWSSTTADTSDVLAYSVAIMPPLKKISPHNYPKKNACSVRLVKD